MIPIQTKNKGYKPFFSDSILHLKCYNKFTMHHILFEILNQSSQKSFRYAKKSDFFLDNFVYK